MKRLLIEFLQKNLKPIVIIILWVFHITAVIGVTLGFKDWFISKTPITLTLMFISLIIYYPIKQIRYWFIGFILFAGGFMAEWIGVHYGILFGDYHYGNNLGFKLDGIPLMIGVNWSILVLITGVISNHISSRIVTRATIGAVLMVFLDFFMETSAPIFDFWIWDIGYAPLQNYIAWFGVALLLQFIFQISKITGDLAISLHLYGAQLIFFIYFYGFYSI
ncbi:carotenoid biosynthesis protein [Fulvivirga sp.]|uniref:carotenoid biosynthesis protein n=1 Tax=Fulvivirga sp. TaxID=1931237 RepID=UPI0032EF7BE3